MKSIKLFTTIFAVAGFFLIVSAQTHTEKAISTFRNMFSVVDAGIKVPTVLEVPLTGISNDYHLGVYDKTASSFVPHRLIGGNIKLAIPSSVSASFGSSVSSLGDGNYGTFAEFDLPESGAGRTSISFRFTKAIRSTSLSFALDQFVALPTSVTIRANVGGVEKVVLSNTRPTSSTLTFLETVSEYWTIDLSYSQPLRISELSIDNKDVSSAGSSVRFLAEPNHEYDIYLNPETIVYVEVGESGNLTDNTGVKKVTASSVRTNQAYKEADTDSDGISDIKDNCVRTANSDQKDEDENGRGDVCDDYDRDGAINSLDNCQNKPNQNQQDTDNDGMGDICDGEESRLTEKYPVLVWMGIGFAVLIFAAMFYMTLRKARQNNLETPPGPSNPLN